MAHLLRLHHKLFTLNVQKRWVTTRENRIKMNRDRKVGPTIDASTDSLAAKGFLRPQKAYTPPPNVSEQVDTIYTTLFGNNKPASQNFTNDEKMKFLLACESELNHCVSNSLLFTIKSLDDVKKFYETPVNTTLPLDAIYNAAPELPKNLHIQYDYHRFHPDTDTKFNGVTAFPESSNIVTGLKARKKYEGFVAKKAWLK